VALLLQQLKVNLHGLGNNLIQAASYDLAPRAGFDLPKCETDFVSIYLRTYPDKAAFIIGECKDEGDRIDESDIEKSEAGSRRNS
jgi:hypothetical protein